MRFVAGGDLLFGNGEGRGATFVYSAPSTAQSAASRARADRRSIATPRAGATFGGGYVLAEIDAGRSRARSSTGLRLNVDEPSARGEGESRNAHASERIAGRHRAACGNGGEDHVNGCTRLSRTRSSRPPSTSRWRRTKACSSPKPSSSVEGGVKVRAAGRADRRSKPPSSAWTSRTWSRRPSSTGCRRSSTSGETRFQGVELAGDVRLRPRCLRPRDLQLPRRDASSTSCRRSTACRRSSAASGSRCRRGTSRPLGLILAPAHGLTGSVDRQAHRRPLPEQAQHRARRAVHDARRRASATGSRECEVRAGWAEPHATGAIRSSESELGDAQYYRLFARTFRASVGLRF